MIDREQASAFNDADVARAYVYRPPYPEVLYDFLVGLTPEHRQALDLGCGPGKIARNLAARFDYVDAVDPSLPMLRLAAEGTSDNIRWIHDQAETAELADSYDLITAGASIHWMDHGVLFPKLIRVLSEGGYLAVIDGDGAHEVAWEAEWEVFLQRWLDQLGRVYDPDFRGKSMRSFEGWLEIEGRRSFEAPFSQRVEEFIECQHSRATWSRASMGTDLAEQFDEELGELLTPYAVDGVISYTTIATVVWGTPRTTTGEV